jgi:hypothetical protein
MSSTTGRALFTWQHILLNDWENAPQSPTWALSRDDTEPRHRDAVQLDIPEHAICPTVLPRHTDCEYELPELMLAWAFVVPLSLSIVWAFGSAQFVTSDTPGVVSEQHTL